MRVRVLFFGVLKEMAGTSAEEVELTPGASVADVLAEYKNKIPKLGSMFPSVALAVNQQYAKPETRLNANDEVALLPPVSGGAPEVRSKPESPAGTRVSIVRKPIDTIGTLAALKSEEDGAALVFEGVVRNQTRGRQTLYLDYEAYEPMALQELQSLATQALAKFEVRDVAVIHRLGRMEIGETSVLIVVASAHRAAAFEACRWLIDTLKRTVPIWKKEYFVDGAVWADGEPFPEEIRRAET
ncbi:MAG TPA: molybdenum cofactor biosynthesis protein MoaE [Candidatus Sulfotelmatobacter sp.]|nr:molybdenum cofactor biosynthesis protein MoaE [Candidatus Sulfotelmatobacter sp.]